MATVIIDGDAEIQIEGTTLKNLQSAYPNCWLKFEGENIAVRLPSYILEGGRRYILHKPKVGTNISIQVSLQKENSIYILYSSTNHFTNKLFNIFVVLFNNLIAISIHIIFIFYLIYLVAAN
jgi:hypothetical protein